MFKHTKFYSEKDKENFIRFSNNLKPVLSKFIGADRFLTVKLLQELGMDPGESEGLVMDISKNEFRKLTRYGIIPLKIKQALNRTEIIS